MANADYSKWKKQLYGARHALTARKPREYIVKDLMFTQSLSMIYGFSGSLKTNLMMDLAVCIALGKPWLSSPTHKGFETKQCPILWIDADSGIDTLHERFEAMLRAHGGNRTTPVHYISFADPPFLALDPHAKMHMIELIQEYQAGFLCFDNLGTTSGARDENSSEMASVMSAIRFIVVKTDVAAGVIHHNPKTEQERRSPRGHSSIEASLDLALYCAKDDDVVTLTPTKTRQAPVPSFSALWKWKHKPSTHELETAHFVGVDADADPTTLKAHSAILAVFQLNGRKANQSQLVAACVKSKVSRNKALTEIENLVRQHSIIQEPERGAHNQAIYKLPDK